jgi:ATP-dependent helicase/nuclease subunit A
MNEAMVRDDTARSAALDITHSYIVQAPAGSGKTGLLIQRFLALLANVAQPEAIVAMTFTRKAAGEILERIIDALRSAHTSPEPAAPHDALTWRLARTVLERDAAQGWNLLAHPARLRILTIDALCSALMRQAPLTAKLGAMPRFVERAEALYTRAAREELNAASPTNTSWRKLLDYLDNDADRVVRLLATMLDKRDQWLRHLVTADRSELRALLEESLATEIERELAALDALFPRDLVQELLEQARLAAANLVDETQAHSLAAFATADALPPPTVAALAQWQRLANWLLTKRGGFRARVTSAEGFPVKGKPVGANLFARHRQHSYRGPNEFGPTTPKSDPDFARRVARKESMESLLGQLEAVPGLAHALDLARRLPPPNYDDAGWAFVEALLDVLPRAAARLQLMFAGEGAIDFAEATLVALRALDTETPSDLLLAMDMRIAHLLVDEFQDTSFAQCELIAKLTTGWERGDERTLFLVGDPMQSIYGFREANVGLFVAAQRDRRLGSVDLEPLTLSRNFRSRPELVEWVNRVFFQVLPPRDDPARSAVAFKAAAATRDSGAEPAVTLDLFTDTRREARAVVGHIKAALQHGMQSAAVLVRKRLDLEEILPALRASGIEFKAVGLDRLSERPALLDLMSLTHALLQPSDHLAWLATLRAPWCGLTLSDLLLLGELGQALPDLFTRPDGVDSVAGISPDGRARLARFTLAVAPALTRRGRVPLTMLVRGTWLALGGPACVAEPIDLAAADRYFALLSTHAKGGDVPDWHALADSLAALHVEPDASTTARVQIMTLHRAKGLEFDVVVMPGLTRSSRGRDEQLLLWRERASGLLLAPLSARTPKADKDPLYAYLSALAADEGAGELGRLLYVGCTRARERLHLTANAIIDDHAPEGRRWKQPAKGTSLAALWPAVADDVPSPPSALVVTSASVTTTGIALQRLPLAWRLPSPPRAIAPSRSTGVTGEREAIAFDWARETARQIGIAAHRLLRNIAEDGLARWDEARVAALLPRAERDFGKLGFTAEEARISAALVVEGIATTLADPHGRWLFDPQHVDARSEYALTGERDRALVRVVLDRTFVDVHGTRWIVDFKLSRHEGGDRDAFLDSERERYRLQLEDYARVMRGIDDRPLRVGLYFPLLRGWREWEAPA